jgi:hypothetical protein
MDLAGRPFVGRVVSYTSKQGSVIGKGEHLPANLQARFLGPPEGVLRSFCPIDTCVHRISSVEDTPHYRTLTGGVGCEVTYNCWRVASGMIADVGAGAKAMDAVGFSDPPPLCLIYYNSHAPMHAIFEIQADRLYTVAHHRCDQTPFPRMLHRRHIETQLS